MALGGSGFIITLVFLPNELCLQVNFWLPAAQTQPESWIPSISCITTSNKYPVCQNMPSMASVQSQCHPWICTGVAGGQTLKSIGLHTSGRGNYLSNTTTRTTMIHGMEGTPSDLQRRVLVSQPGRKTCFVLQTKVLRGFQCTWNIPTLFFMPFLRA